MIIEDGKGTGKKARVDSDNQLRTRAVTSEEISFYSSETGKGYSVYGRRNFAAGSTNENILSLTYTGNGKLHIQKIMFSSNSTNAKVEVYFDATGISGGTEITPLNLNRSSAQISEVTALTGGTDLIATVASINEMFDVRLNRNSFLMDFAGAVILSKNDNLFILGEVGTAGDKIRVMVYYYETSD